jgi:hypothetical protein
MLQLIKGLSKDIISSNLYVKVLHAILLLYLLDLGPEEQAFVVEI